MTIHMLFFTIIIKQKAISRKEAFHQEQIQKWHDRNLDRTLQVPLIM
ncbi:uncharacterized protein (TIGR02413 family) [Peribacillus deserti]|uniref:Uncharacterized protein (TIGR02413 family) n=1 Tax=Peribacillus deserti TaxID=673318 RepID=A0ABS2QFC9_9BACI|nr:YrzI family small protein [Peribacillus deserti]MBM7691852.1 uncharacterized protein (TIGR02413 family) [Peribacillus deserti]